MAFIRTVTKRKATYYYVVKSVRRGDTVRQKVLEYLGRDPTPARLRKALVYWGVKTKANPGGRVKR